MARLHDSLERRQAALQSLPLTLDSSNNDHRIETAEERALTLELVTQSLEISNSSTAIGSIQTEASTQPNPINGINLIRSMVFFPARCFPPMPLQCFFPRPSDSTPC